MNKIIAFLMAVLIILSMTACTKNDETGSDNSGTANPSVSDKTVGQTLSDDFKSDTTGTAQEIADRIISNKIIQFMGGTMPVEEGLLSGFDNTEIKGFKDGVMFAPMMSSIAFVGYIFELDEGADVESFKTTLKNSANMRWNICVEAEELIVESEKNKVFFLMCPKSFEQPEAEGDGAAAGDMPAEDGIILE